MYIEEKNIPVIIDALVNKINSLQSEIWWRDEQIKKLKAQLEAKGEHNGKL